MSIAARFYDVEGDQRLGKIGINSFGAHSRMLREAVDQVPRLEEQRKKNVSLVLRGEAN